MTTISISTEPTINPITSIQITPLPLPVWDRQVIIVGSNGEPYQAEIIAPCGGGFFTMVIVQGAPVRRPRNLDAALVGMCGWEQADAVIDRVHVSRIACQFEYADYVAATS